MKRLSRRPGRKLMVMLLATSMAGLPLASEAKLGGSSSGRSVSVTRSAPSPTASSSSSRLGGGSSAGMTRPDVMAKARSNTAAPAGAYAGGTPMPAAPAPAAPRSGPGWGTVAGAAAVGAAAGYMMGDHNSPQASGNASQGNGGSLAGPGASPDMQRSAAEAGAPLSHEKSSGGFGFGSLLGLLAMGGLGLWAFRKYQAGQRPQFANRSEPGASFKVSDAPVFGSSAPASNADAAVEQLALKAFNELQDANNRGDLAFLRTRVDDLLFQQLEADITQRGGPGRTTVVSMRPQVLDVTDQGSRKLVSIQYTGTIIEGPDAAPERLDEVWHFVDENRGFWKLAGIEQV